MARVRRFLLRLVNVFRPQKAEPDLARELASHLGLLDEDFERLGMPPDEARRAARRAFGGVEQTRERHRETRSLVWLSDAGRDLRHGARALRRDPLFALTAALSLGIGIGASTTIFTLANALLFQPPTGVNDPRRLVDIGRSRHGDGFGPSSFANYLDIRQRTTTLAGVYGYSRFPHAMSLGTANSSAAENILGTDVTANYFTVLGAVPAAGRLFDVSDSDRPGASPIAVLSYGFWTRRFNRDPAVVGRSLTLNGRLFTVVGVASEGFRGTGVRAGDVWLPIGMAAVTAQGAATLANRAAPSLLIGGRLKPGVPVSEAAAEMDAIGRTLAREYPEQNRDAGLRLLASSPTPGNTGPIVAFLALLTAIVSLVLAVACANVAGVLLARATARRQEIAVRLTMGAGRARLVRQLLTETLLLFALGAAAGLLLARAGTSLLVSMLPSLPFPVDVSIALDGRAVVFTTGLALVAALLSGLAPAIHGSKADVASALKNDAQAPTRLRLRHVFVVAQVTLSVLLVAVGSLFGRALQQASSIDPGFEPHGIELASLDVSQAGYTNATGPRFVRELLDRVRALPDVSAAAVATVVPGGFETMRSAMTVPGVSPPDGQPFFSVDWTIVEPGYFATLRIPVAAGRDFNPADRDGTPPVAIVSETAARQFWPGRPAQDAIGRYLAQPVFGPHGPTGETRALRVVGVAHDVRFSSVIDGVSLSCVYVPLPQEYRPNITIVARTTRGQRIPDELRALVASMNPNLPIITAQTLEDSLALGLTPQRIVASVAGGLGMVGLLLAAIGIYGVTAYVVARRTREIGIRVALGAERAHVIATIVRQGMTLVIAGSALGLTFAAAAGSILTSHLFGLPPIDPLTFSGVAALFVLIGLAACYAPARRATQVDAMEALRQE